MSTPTNISTKSKPETVTNDTLASLAVARTNRAGAGRTDKQRAVRNLVAEALDFLEVLQKLGNLSELLGSFLDAGDFVGGRARGGFRR